MIARPRRGLWMVIAIGLGVVTAPLAGCTSSVNFVVTDGGWGDVSTDGVVVTGLDARDEEAAPPSFLTGTPVAGPSRYVQYQCCTDGSGCVIVFQGDETTCRDLYTWTIYATADCNGRGPGPFTTSGVSLFVGC